MRLEIDGEIHQKLNCKLEVLYFYFTIFVLGFRVWCSNNKYKETFIYSRWPNCTIGLTYSRDSSGGNKGIIYSRGGCVIFNFCTCRKELNTVAI